MVFQRPLTADTAYEGDERMTNEPDEGNDAGKTYPSGDCDLQLIVPERTA